MKQREACKFASDTTKAPQETEYRKWQVDMFGGRLMDTFMDKLAQKLTAQEMIKANMAADAEEMSRLKAKDKEYAECLEQLQMLITDATAKVSAAGDAAEKQLNEEVRTALEELKKLIADEQESLQELNTLQELQTLLQDVKAATDAIDNSVKDKFESVNDSVHKECVKVYRNVQAVVVEENAKQTEMLTGAVNSLKGKLNAILGISIAALVLALGSVAMQVMNLLNLKLF